MTAARLLLLSLCLAAAPAIAAAEERPVNITVVVVLASANKTDVHPKLADLAKEVRKTREKLTGFKLETTLTASIPVGESHTFELPDKQSMKVTVVMPKDKTGRIGLSLLPPGAEEVQYACVCDKFVPIITPHVTKAGDTLIVAILAKPCTGK